MALDAGFVAAVLEGIEGTLDEVIERVKISELRASLDVLESRVVALRVSSQPKLACTVQNAPKKLSRWTVAFRLCSVDRLIVTSKSDRSD